MIIAKLNVEIVDNKKLIVQKNLCVSLGLSDARR